MLQKDIDHLRRLVQYNKYDETQLSIEKKMYRSKKLQDFLEKHAKVRVPSDSEEVDEVLEGGNED
jgi:hypothetical protein